MVPAFIPITIGKYPYDFFGKAENLPSAIQITKLNL